MSLNVKSSFETNYSMLITLAPALKEPGAVKKPLRCEGYRIDTISRDELNRPIAISIETTPEHEGAYQAFELNLSHDIHFAMPYLRRHNGAVYSVSSATHSSGIEMGDLSAALESLLFNLHAHDCRFKEACHE